MKSELMLGPWILGSLYLAIAILLIANRRILLSLPFLYLSAMHLPIFPFTLPVWAQIVTTLVAYLMYIAFWFGGMMTQEEMFLSSSGKRAVLNEYDRHMRDWPVEYSEKDVATTFGDIHIIDTGKTATSDQTIVLLHAASMSSWSWKLNRGILGNGGRVIAIDLPGEVGKSTLSSLSRPVMSDEDIGLLFSEIFKALEVDSAILIGASAGGHQAMRIALQMPERVEALCLTGPMGISNPIRPLITMTAGMLAPIEPVNRILTRWALGTSEVIRQEAYQWFHLVLRHVIGRPTAPRQLTDEEMSAIECPILLILAEDDNLVGSADAALIRAQTNFKDIQAHILPGSHLANLEQASQVDSLITGFLRDLESED
jgi:pimeloyl-ACP methyl ester carboxylesterase